MSKHTPGPWNNGIGQIVFQGEGWDPYGRQRRIATCEPSTRTQKDWEETWANARLIAAAPDLLAALTQISDYARKDGDAIAQHLAVIARAAIAKATGESQ